MVKVIMTKIAIYCDNVLAPYGVGFMHAYMMDHRQKKGEWPTFWRCICTLNKHDIAADEWELRTAYFKIKESES